MASGTRLSGQFRNDADGTHPSNGLSWDRDEPWLTQPGEDYRTRSNPYPAMDGGNLEEATAEHPEEDGLNMAACSPAGRRSASDESYVIDLCDRILDQASLRQHRLPFLLGDPGKAGRRVALPVDAFYPALSLAIEYHERQHLDAIAHFDKPDRLTVSGVHRGEQRRIYDERRRLILPKHGVTLLVISFAQLHHRASGRLVRSTNADAIAVRAALEGAGVEFIAENGGGPGVRLKKPMA